MNNITVEKIKKDLRKYIVLLQAGKLSAELFEEFKRAYKNYKRSLEDTPMLDCENFITSAREEYDAAKEKIEQSLVNDVA